MKNIDELVQYLNETATMYQTISANKLEEDNETDAAFNEGIAKGIELAVNRLKGLDNETKREDEKKYSLNRTGF